MSLPTTATASTGERVPQDMQELVLDDDLEFLKLDLTTGKKKRSRQRESKASNSENHTDIYSYEYLLQRVYGNLQQNNPNLTGAPSKTRLQPLDVQRGGVRRTVVTNFQKLCKTLGRDSDHVMSYILSELAVPGNLDGTNRLIVRGKFSPMAISTVARNYIKDYVICDECKSLETIMDKDKATRLIFLRCQCCHGVRTLQPIVQGYRAKI